MSSRGSRTSRRRLKFFLVLRQRRGFFGTWAGEGLSLPTALSLMMPWALVLAADMAAGVGPAKDPKRREKMEEMVGNWGLRWRGYWRGDGRGGAGFIYR